MMKINFENNMFVLMLTIFILTTNSIFTQTLKTNEIIYGGWQYYYPPGQLGRKIITHLGDRTTIYKRDMNSRETKVIFKGSVTQKSVSISPDRKHIASIQVGIRHEKKPYRSINNLIVLDVEGNLVHEIDADVRHYSWSPDGQKITYITGDYYEGGRGYIVTGHWILDVVSGESRKINAQGYHLIWAEFDNNIYLKGKKYISERSSIPMVYKYNPISNKLKETEYKGIHFSSDGQYYYRAQGFEGIEFRLYESESNIDITDRLYVLNLHPLTMRGEWISKDVIIIHGADITENGRPRKSIIYDINSNVVLKESLGSPILKLTANGISKIIMENETHTITGNQIETIQKTWSD